MEQFLTYASGRYLKISLLLTVIVSIIYVMHEPGQPKNGGTWFGYTIGTISALLIVWLMYFGRRKRAYYSTLGTVKGWLSAHVYLGSGLLVLATLHTGFQFGLNVHTLAYALMCIAIFSGFYGAWAYVYLPIKKRANLKTISAEEYYLSIEDVDRQIIKLSKELPAPLKLMINSAIERTEIGGDLFDQLSIEDKSCLLFNGELYANEDQSGCIHLLVEELAKVTDQQSAIQLKQLIDLFGRRKKSLKTLRYHIKTNALLKLWLYIHVPVSFALLAALIVHILSVFIYW